MISSNIFALGKKEWPRQRHRLSRGEEPVEGSWELVEFTIAKIMLEDLKLLQPKHASVFLCYMHRES